MPNETTPINIDYLYGKKMTMPLDKQLEVAPDEALWTLLDEVNVRLSALGVKDSINDIWFYASKEGARYESKQEPWGTMMPPTAMNCLAVLNEYQPGLRQDLKDKEFTQLLQTISVISLIGEQVFARGIGKQVPARFRNSPPLKTK